MIVRCPACGAEASLDTLVENDAAAQALKTALEFAPGGALLVRYLGLFRPAKRKLTWPRVAALLDELLPAIRAERVERDGRVIDAPLTAWWSALDKTLQARDSGQLRTPLKSHGYLFEIVISEAARLQPVGWADAGSPTQTTPATKPGSAAAKSIDVLSARKRGLNADR